MGLERKTTRLKRLLRERGLEIDAMRELLVSALQRRGVVRFLHRFKASQRRGCAPVKIGWSGYRYVAHLSG